MAANRFYSLQLPIMFGLVILISIVDLGFAASLIDTGRRGIGFWSNTMRIRCNFNLFVSIWTIVLSAVFLGVALFSSLFSWLYHTVFLLITFIFWVATAASMQTLYLGRSNCSATSRFSRCHRVETAAILSWINTVLVLILIIMWATFGRADRYSRKNASHA